MGIGPVGAAHKVLERAGIGFDDLDLIEVNEAFAVQVLAVLQGGAYPRRRRGPAERERFGHLTGASDRRHRRADPRDDAASCAAAAAGGR